jgi:hypothetical protein
MEKADPLIAASFRSNTHLLKGKFQFFVLFRPRLALKLVGSAERPLKKNLKISRSVSVKFYDHELKINFLARFSPVLESAFFTLTKI